MINWTVRIRNRNFWIAIIPAMLLLAQSGAALFGYQLELSEVQTRLLTVVNAIFGVLTVLGVVNDPTTAGISDSKQAMTYSHPREDTPPNPEYV